MLSVTVAYPAMPVAPSATTPLLAVLEPALAYTPVPPELEELAVIDPALKLPVPSRLTMALAVSPLVGDVFQFRARVPLPKTGDPLTVKSELGALSATLLTFPAP